MGECLAGPGSTGYSTGADLWWRLRGLGGRPALCGPGPICTILLSIPLHFAPHDNLRDTGPYCYAVPLYLLRRVLSNVLALIVAKK